MEDGIEKQMVFSDGIPAVSWSRRLLELRSEPFREGKNAQIYVPWNKNRSKLLEKLF